MKTIALLLLVLCLASCGHTRGTRVSTIQGEAVDEPWLLMVGGDAVSAKVIGCHDGDTIKVLLRGKPTSIRLEGIDAPELGQPYGRNSREALASMVLGREVVIRKSRTPDRYGRTIGRVFILPSISGMTAEVNLKMIRQGLAWYFLAGHKDMELAEAEQDARTARIGLWADRRPTPPWVWRKIKR